MRNEELTNHVRMLVGSRLVRRDGVEYLSIPVYELVKRFKTYGDQRELAGCIDENKRWLTVLAPSMDENVVYNSDFHDRIAELKAKEVKGE